MKKGQSSITLVILLVLILILILVMIFIVVSKSGLMSGSVVSTPTNEETTLTPSSSSDYLTCNSPYIINGNSCCLDQNNNKICDKDETQQTTTTQTNTVNDQTNYNTCYSPYIRRGGSGSSCCLDNDNNRVCDDEEIQRQSEVTKSDIDSPFKLKSFKVYQDELKFTLENRAGYDVLVKSINVEDCDSQDLDITIKSESTKKIDLDCDFNYGSFNDDIDVDYVENGTNLTQTASGTIKGNIYRDDNYYNNNYYNNNN